MKKTIAFLLSLLMLAALFSGCSQQSASTAPESQAPATEAPESQAPIDAAPESAAPETQEPQAEGVDLTILYEADDDMINNYSLLAVNPDAPFVDADGNPVSDVYVNTEGAAALINWMLSEEGKAAIADYGYADYGEYLFYLIEDGPASTAEVPAATDETRVIRMSTTTSVNDSGLLAYLLPLFEEAYGYTVEVTSAGTGRAIANAESGNADLLLVHSKSQEEEFIAGGYSYDLHVQLLRPVRPLQRSRRGKGRCQRPGCLRRHRRGKVPLRFPGRSVRHPYKGDIPVARGSGHHRGCGLCRGL